MESITITGKLPEDSNTVKLAEKGRQGAESGQGVQPPEGAPKPPPPPFAMPPAQPCMELGCGVRFDFNDGARIATPADGPTYRCVFTDADTECVVYSMDVPPGMTVVSYKKFWVRWRLEIYEAGKPEGKPLASHEYNAKGRAVLMQLPVGTLGDSIAWFSYVERFALQHGCKVICSMAPAIAEIFKAQYPDIEFVTKEEAEKREPYATYNLGLYFKGDTDHQPEDHRYAGLHHTVGNILGVPLEDLPPRVDLTQPVPVQGPYVAIATQASSQAKYWNNPTGWHEVIDWLRGIGYKVVCIDKDRVCGGGLTYNHIPWGVEDDTGNKPLQERINVIRGADAFIGLSSGLTWLAWCCHVPVVMISGFTEPANEFYTPYRVINRHVCNGCWNDMRCDFDHYDYLWCPRHKGTPRHFECTRAITGAQVIKMLRKVPAIAAHIDNGGMDNQ